MILVFWKRDRKMLIIVMVFSLSNRVTPGLAVSSSIFCLISLIQSKLDYNKVLTTDQNYSAPEETVQAIDASQLTAQDICSLTFILQFYKILNRFIRITFKQLIINYKFK